MATTTIEEQLEARVRELERELDRVTHLEEKLEASEERLHTIFNSVQAGILLMDAESHEVVDANPRALELLKWRREDVLGQVCHRFICPTAKGNCPITDLGQTLDNTERRMLRADGEELPILKTVVPVTLAGRRYLLESFLDISDRKRAERELAEWNQRLEERVERKTRQLKEAQDKLVQTEKMAAMGELVAGAAHELNNPVAGIIGAIQLLRADKVKLRDGSGPLTLTPEQELECLGQMEEAAARCKQIVDDLLKFARPSKHAFRRLDVNQVVTDTLRLFAHQFGEANVHLREQLAAELPMVVGDPVLLQQVFANVLFNARDAMPGGGLIDVATGVQDCADEPNVCVSFRDTGVGIPAEHVDKVFDPFFTTRPPGQGTGLGLSVSYGIIKEHGGHIRVESAVSEGTTITVCVPIS